MASISVDPIASPRIITVDAPTASITIQELYDLIRDWEDESINLAYDHLVEGAGKQALGGGAFVGVTMTLLNAKIAFEARSGPAFEQCVISGGNLVAIDDTLTVISPIEPTAFTQVVIAQSTSPSIITSIPVRGQPIPRFTFTMFDAVTRERKSGLTVTAYRRLDGGTLTVCDNSVVELGGGDYYIDLTGNDTNATVVYLLFVATGAEDRPITFLTAVA